jgi:hypothetical protein
MADYLFYFRHSKEEIWNEDPLYNIGASALLELEDIETHTDDNSVYVSWTGDDGTGGDGTEDFPYRTLQYARDMMDSGQTIITILDSNYYYTGDGIDLYFDLDGITVQGSEGQKPILRIDTTIANQITMIRLQNGGKIINCDIQVDTEYNEQTTAIDARDGEIKNVTIEYANKYAVQKTTSGVVDITNCILKNSINDGNVDGSAIAISEGTLNLLRCQITGNDYSGIIITGSSSKIIDIDYCTIADNQYGIYTSGSSNVNLSITNSIIYKNKIYDHYGDDGNYSYSCIGKIQGTPTLATASVVLRINPLFIGDDDYNLRSAYNGYGESLMLSPCLGVSEDLIDLGCFQYTRSLTSLDFRNFTISPPLSVVKSKISVDAKLVTVNSLKSKLLERGTINKLELSWTGIDNIITEEEYLNLEALFESEGNIYLSMDEEVSYTQYVLDKTRGLNASRCLNKPENTLYKGVNITLYET